MRILVAGINPALKCVDNVAFIGTATGNNLEIILKATKLKRDIFVTGNLYPNSTPKNRPLNKDERIVAETNGAYYLAAYDGVIVLGSQASKIMLKAEKLYSLGQWSAIPHPSPRNLQTNNEEFVNDCAQLVRSFVFRVFETASVAGNRVSAEPESGYSQSPVIGHLGNRRNHLSR
jgi:hypothetical protein